MYVKTMLYDKKIDNSRSTIRPSKRWLWYYSENSHITSWSYSSMHFMKFSHSENIQFSL